ncbi:hypothetical protein LBMAG42_24140 [Deltaproteobacteria bacterium]|nr:hypothetical protein LBMAG42_24140 [Deltaproteobacteria bacterium]
MALRLPLGTSDFAQLRRDGDHYVDKSGLAVELIRTSSRVVLLPRPRRFGKTLNLSMLRYWFERPVEPGGTDIAGLFAGLDVTTAGEDVAARFQRHPVIFLTFKDVKNKTWETCRANVVALLRSEVLRHRPTWSAVALADDDRQVLEALASGTATDSALQSALRVLCRAIALGTGEDAVLLIDEYDTPIHSGWIHGYYDEVIELFRNLLSGGLKDNPHIYRGVLTGILRVAKESIFSGLNNVSVHTMLSGPFSRWFGFTDAEVDELCRLAGPEADREGIREWYNGYLMGGHVVYNPWSVLSYLAAMSDGFKPYWINTASDEILRRLLIGAGLGIQAELAALVAGGELVEQVSEDIQLRDLGKGGSDVWSFLLFSGYLKATDVRIGDRTVATLKIPNREVVLAYRAMFLRWFEAGVGTGREVDALCRSLLSGDEIGFEGRLQRLVVNSLSYFDVGGRTPEAVYQAFLVGLLVQLDATHIVDANREAGFGRYDVCVRPRLPAGAGLSPAVGAAPGSRAGAVLELKVVDPNRETWEAALDSAMRQIHDRAYAAAAREAGADPVWLWAAVFDGKRVRVKVEPG